MVPVREKIGSIHIDNWNIDKASVKRLIEQLNCSDAEKCEFNEFLDKVEVIEKKISESFFCDFPGYLKLMSQSSEMLEQMNGKIRFMLDQQNVLLKA